MGHVDGQPHPVPVTPLLAAAVDLVLSFEQCLGRVKPLQGLVMCCVMSQNNQQQQPACLVLQPSLCFSAPSSIIPVTVTGLTSEV